MKRNKGLMENVVVAHGKDANDRCFTIAGRIQDSQVRFGISICNDTDQFCKKTGRRIAATRTIGRPIQVVDAKELEGMSKSDKYKFAMQKMFELKAEVTSVENYFVRNQEQ